MAELAGPESVEYRLVSRWIRPFDPAAPYFVQRLEFDRRRVEDVLALIRRERPSGRVLDLGAAPYILTASLLGLGYEVTVSGLPFEDESDGTAAIRVAGREHACPLYLFDVEDVFPLPAGAFDVVVAGELLEHLYRRPWSMLAEAWRCLADDGLLVLTTPNSESLETLYAWLRRLPRGQGFNPDVPTVRHAREYGPGEVRAVLESQGLTVVELRTPSYSHIRAGFRGPLGPAKRAVYAALKRQAGAPRGPLSGRGDTILAAARKDAGRPPGPPPSFMLYGIGDPRGGFNFPEGTSRALA